MLAGLSLITAIFLSTTSQHLTLPLAYSALWRVLLSKLPNAVIQLLSYTLFTDCKSLMESNKNALSKAV